MQNSFSDPSWTIISFYTKDTPYEAEIHNLRKSLAALHIPYRFKWYDNRGSWERNCAIKPEFIREMLDRIDTDLVFVDADATFQQYPTLFDSISADIGVHYLGDELLSGTIYLKNNQRVREIVDTWIVLQQANPEVWDQRILQRILDTKKEEVSVERLPPQYTQIFDTMSQWPDPVILHHQASRRFKGHVLQVC